jgi:hypothetical protein
MPSAQRPSNVSVPIDNSGKQNGKQQPVSNLADQPRVFPPPCNCAQQPGFSIPEGQLAEGNQVIITSPSPNATIFYTTDGWTPTTESTRYTTPVTINATTRLQAIAFEPAKLPSPIAERTYTVSGVPPRPERSLTITNPLPKGTLLRVVTGSRVNSQTAQVGDRILLMLDENLVVNGTMVAPDGTAVEGTITKVERAGLGGKSGVIAFQAQSLNIHGTSVPLNAILTLAAPARGKSAQNNPNGMIVNIAGEPIRGTDVEIEAGLAFTAEVATDTPLRP